MRQFGLYLRSRGAPAAGTAMVSAVGLLWLLGLASREQGRIAPAVAVLATATALGAVAPGLRGQDRDLDRTAALPWASRRLAHLAGAAVATAAVLLAVEATGYPFAPAALIVRDVAGLAGLTGLTAAVAGARVAWLPSLLWATATLVYSPGSHPLSRVVGTWLTQPAGSRPAAVTAAVLAVAGAAAYARYGSRD